MPDYGGPDRVRKMRRARKEQGFTETNVWLPNPVRQAIDQVVIRGEFPSRRQAIIAALEKAYIEQKTGT